MSKLLLNFGPRKKPDNAAETISNVLQDLLLLPSTPIPLPLCYQALFVIFLSLSFRGDPLSFPFP